MRLARFGMITIDGIALRPQPGADFTAYQTILTNSRTMLAMKKKIDAGRTRKSAQCTKHATAPKK